MYYYYYTPTTNPYHPPATPTGSPTISFRDNNAYYQQYEQPFVPEYPPSPDTPYPPSPSNITYMPQSPVVGVIPHSPNEASYYQDVNPAKLFEDLSGYVKQIDTDKGLVYQCTFPECEKTFTRTYSLKAHLRTHSTVRPYKCSVCQRSFLRKHDCLRHIRIHTKERPYQCACGKSFARQDALKRHLQMEDKCRDIMEQYKGQRKRIQQLSSPYLMFNEEVVPEDFIE
eukprot:NODE_252_length_12846_cov_0.309485.p4 type:complete len:227 gc:universal NODE_252_length_12846_cov_0.309485:8919-9599(+)